MPASPTDGRYAFAYAARLKRDDGQVSVTFRDFSEAGTWGADRAEALAMAEDALVETVAMRIKLGEAIPDPSPRRRGEVLVALPSLVAAKAALYRTMRAERVSKAALARAMGTHFRQVARLLDVNHASRLDQIDAAFRALGHRLEIAVGRAA